MAEAVLAGGRMSITASSMLTRLLDVAEAARLAEWGPNGVDPCPVCIALRSDGHFPSCELGAALTALDSATAKRSLPKVQP